MGKKHGLLRNVAGEMVLWVKGTEVMAFDTSKASFFASAPAAQQTTIADAGATNTGDRSAVINARIAVNETFGINAA
jgi:hypothetical protein